LTNNNPIINDLNNKTIKLKDLKMGNWKPLYSLLSLKNIILIIKSMKFTASRLSSGNKIFPAEIYLESTGITIKIPGLFSGETKHFDFNHIASVEIDTPLIGYSSITIFAGGTMMAANGFTKAEVKQIKEGIEKGKQNAKTAVTNDTTETNSSTKISIADELIKLKELMDNGVITATEFEEQKQKMLRN
jgi:hypothetical protein